MLFAAGIALGLAGAAALVAALQPRRARRIRVHRLPLVLSAETARPPVEVKT